MCFMELFGKPATRLFESFYKAHVAAHIHSVKVSFHEIPDDAPSIRGQGSLEFGFTVQDAMRPEMAEIHIRSGLAAAEFERTLAHEFLHVVSRALRFPQPALDPRIPANTPEMGLVRDLITIDCVANDRLLRSLGFGPGSLSPIRVQRLLKRITETSGATDDLSKPWAVRTTIHYVRALLESGPAAMSEVRVSLEKLPRIRGKGDKLYLAVSPLDLWDHGQRLRALVLIRDTLSLNGRVDIIEPGKGSKTHQ